MTIYTDGSYKTSQCFTNSKTVEFTSAFLTEKETIEIQNKIIKRFPELKHYGNLAELTAIELAIKYLKKNKTSAPKLFLTDSKTIESWMKSAILGKNKKFATKEHSRVYNFLIKNLKDCEIKWVPREQNKIGIILEQLGYY